MSLIVLKMSSEIDVYNEWDLLDMVMAGCESIPKMAEVPGQTMNGTLEWVPETGSFSFQYDPRKEEAYDKIEALWEVSGDVWTLVDSYEKAGILTAEEGAVLKTLY